MVDIASRKVPAFLTCSQVRVVKDVHRGVMGVLMGRTRTDWWWSYVKCQYLQGYVFESALLTSGRLGSLASTITQPISMTSALSFVTYTPCSSQVVAM